MTFRWLTLFLDFPAGSFDAGVAFWREVTGDPGKRLPRELSQKYLGEDPPPEPDEVARVIVRVIPERVNSFSV